MKDNVIQFPDLSELEWKEHDALIRSACKKYNIPGDFTEELCQTMKAILLEVNNEKDFSVSNDGDVQKTVENAVEQVSDHYKLIVKSLLGEIVSREFELYKYRKNQ